MFGPAWISGAGWACRQPNRLNHYSRRCCLVMCARDKRRGEPVRSPQLLVRFFRSRFVAYMDELARRAKLAGKMPFQEDPPSAMDQCLLAAGQAHENFIMEYLVTELGVDLVSVPRGPGAGKLTKQYIKEGREVIHQAALRETHSDTDNMLFGGYADFLFRDMGGADWVDIIRDGGAALEQARSESVPSDSPPAYFVCEVKMAGYPRGEYVIQAVCYTDLMSKMTGYPPAPKLYLWLGNNNRTCSNAETTENGITPPQALSTEDYMAFYRNLRSSLQCSLRKWSYDVNAAARDIRNLAVLPDCSPDNLRPWKTTAQKYLDHVDDLSRVAGLRQTQAAKLKNAGVSTSKHLASMDGNVSALNAARKETGIPRATLIRLAKQSSLQWETWLRRERDEDSPPAFEVLEPSNPGHYGLARLRSASSMDVYFDMESYPLEKDGGGLEYLFGATVWSEGPSGKATERGLPDHFHTWWAHDRFDENEAFLSFVDWVWRRYLKDSEMSVYHYGSYEQSALRRLSARSRGPRGVQAEQRLSSMFHANVFVDVYQIVRESILLGEESYSIKHVESLYGVERGVDNVQDAASSVAMYYQWRCDGKDDQNVLDDIAKYNFQDCDSLDRLVDWLRRLQVEKAISYCPPFSTPVPNGESEGGETSDSQEDPSKKHNPVVLREEILARLYASFEEPEFPDLLVQLVDFHRRESLPDKMRFAERVRLGTGPEATLDELVINDANLVKVTPPERGRRSKSNTAEYRFDEYQTFRLAEKSNVALISSDIDGPNHVVSAFGSIVEIGDGHASISLSPKYDAPRDAAIVDSSHLTISTASVEKSILAFAQNTTSKKDGWLDSFLRKERMCLKQDLRVEEEHVLMLASELDNSFIIVQGPPGTGKTSKCSEIIDHLVAQGRTVAVSSNSHASINNLLSKVATRNKTIKIAKIGGADRLDSVKQKSSIDNLEVGTKSEKSFAVVGATVFQLSRPSATLLFDYLLVDEAGQVSLANLVAMGRCSRNAILVGDQQQLDMPLKGFHEGGSGRSALRHLLDDGVATVPADLGILLSTTYRLPSAICELLSSSIYAGRLSAHSSTATHRLHLAPSGSPLITKSRGLLFVPRVDWSPQDTTMRSASEACVIRRLVEELHQANFTTSRSSGKLDGSSILVVAPYNAQVKLLKTELGPLARVGTVDKFQGQQAPVVLISMCGVGPDGKTDEESPDGAAQSPVDRRASDFVLRVNRLNVAISRAECLAIVVGSPDLARAPCQSIEDMASVNFYCRIMESGLDQERGL